MSTNSYHKSKYRYFTSIILILEGNIMSKYLFSLLCDGKTGHYETDHNNNEKKLVIIIKLVIMKKVFFS